MREQIRYLSKCSNFPEQDRFLMRNLILSDLGHEIRQEQVSGGEGVTLSPDISASLELL